MKKITLMFLLLIGACNNIEKPNLGDLIIAQKYVPGTEDLPVYNGFKPADSKNLSYNSANGRIVDVNYISHDADAEEVRKYYAETLTQLGWNKKKASEYTRDGERLTLNISEKNGVTFLKFVIRPVG